MSEPASLRDAALAYAARGFRVVPLHFPSSTRKAASRAALAGIGDAQPLASIRSRHTGSTTLPTCGPRSTGTGGVGRRRTSAC
jgi:hypothetical protein